MKEKTRGRKLGEKRSLTPQQEKEIQRIIIDKCPDQLKIATCLWTRAAIQQLIKYKYGITIPVRSISNYLNRWGMTCQRPTRKVYSQDDVKLKTFMNETYPAIAVKAKKEGAEIYWGDETGINNQEYHVRGFAPKGQTPTVPSFSKVEKINMISPYSPEINPDEYLNHNLKQSVHSGILPRNKMDLKTKTHSCMRNLQKNPEKVRKLFDHNMLPYIQQCPC